MTVHDLFELVNYISGRHPSGAAIPPARFNVLLPQCNMEFYDFELRKGVKPHSPLYVFKLSADATADADGFAPLPTEFGHWLDGVTTTSGSNNTGIPRGRRIDLIMDSEFRSRQNSITSRQNKPFARLMGSLIELRPKGIEDITIDYLRLPPNPYMDVCQSALNPNLTYFMPVGSYISAYGDGQALYDENDNVIQANVYKNINFLPYHSTTVELEWNPIYHSHLLYRVLVKAGVNLSEEMVTKYAMEASQ